jgi:hypothetical protein
MKQILLSICMIVFAAADSNALIVCETREFTCSTSISMPFVTSPGSPYFCWCKIGGIWKLANEESMTVSNCGTYACKLLCGVP